EHLGALLAQLHQPAPGGEQVDLLGDAVVVLVGLRARWQGRLGEALVHGVPRRGAGELADLRAVLRDERLRPLESLYPHCSEATAVADLADARPGLLGALGAVAREAVALVEAVGALVVRERPDGRLRVAALAQVVQRGRHEGAPDPSSPGGGHGEHRAHLADLAR